MHLLLAPMHLLLDGRDDGCSSRILRDVVDLCHPSQRPPIRPRAGSVAVAPSVHDNAGPHWATTSGSSDSEVGGTCSCPYPGG